MNKSKVTKTQAGKIIGYNEIDTRAFIKKVPHTAATFRTTRAALDSENVSGEKRILLWVVAEIENWQRSAKQQGYKIINIKKTYGPEKSYGAIIGKRVYIQFEIV